MHHSPPSPALWKDMSRPCAFAVMPKHHPPSHQHTGSHIVLAPAVPHHLQALCCLQLADLHCSLACHIISHVPSSSCSCQLPQCHLQMCHSPPFCNVQKPKSELSKELSTTQKASNSQMFTLVTPLARGSQKPSHGLSTPPATFRSTRRPCGKMCRYHI